MQNDETLFVRPITRTKTVYLTHLDRAIEFPLRRRSVEERIAFITRSSVFCFSGYIHVIWVL